MASAFRNTLDFFGEVGLFDVVLPFLLVFSIVFAILEKSKVFGVEEIEGKKYTRKNLNAISAFVVAFFVIASSELVEIITEVSSSVVILLLLIVLFLLLVGSFYMESDKGVHLEGGWKTTFMFIVFVSILLIFLQATGFITDAFDFFKSGTDEIVGSIILLIVVILLVAWMVNAPQPGKQKS